MTFSHVVHHAPLAAKQAKRANHELLAADFADSMGVVNCNCKLLATDHADRDGAGRGLRFAAVRFDSCFSFFRTEGYVERPRRDAAAPATEQIRVIRVIRGPQFPQFCLFSAQHSRLRSLAPFPA